MDPSRPRNPPSELGGPLFPYLWQHEHLSTQMELDALRLLSDAGSPELAKFAIDSVEERRREQLRSDFSQALGFESFGELLAESSDIATNDDKHWFVTSLPDGQWIGWNDVDVRVSVKHNTRDDVICEIEQGRANRPT